MHCHKTQKSLNVTLGRNTMVKFDPSSDLSLRAELLAKEKPTGLGECSNANANFANRAKCFVL